MRTSLTILTWCAVLTGCTSGDPQARIEEPRPAATPAATAPAPAPAQGRTWIVDQTHPAADDQGPGEAGRPFRTIAAAAALAGPGDTVLVRPGVYRERVAPARGGEAGRPVTYQGEPGACVRGSTAWTPAWRIETDGVLAADPDPALFPEGNPFLRTISLAPEDRSGPARPGSEPLAITLGQLFVDGEPWEQVRTRADLARERTWMVDAAGTTLLVRPDQGRPLGARLVELTVRAQVFAPLRRGLRHITVRGLTFEQAANQGPFPQVGMVSVRSGRHWTIEGCTIRHATTIGLDIGSEHWNPAAIACSDPADRRLIIGGGHTVRGNLVAGNGLCGIAGWNHQGSRITGNVVEGNNRLRFPLEKKCWEEWGGIKLHVSDAVIAGNLVRDNHAFGIWIDAGHANAEIRDNAVLRNAKAGVFLELNRSPGRPCRITGNLIAGSHGTGFYSGFGVYTHDAADAVIEGNAFVGNQAEAVMTRIVTNRKAGGQPVEAARLAVRGNLMAGNGGAVAFLWPGERSGDNVSDGNLFAADPAGQRFRLGTALGVKILPEQFAAANQRLAEAGLPALDPAAWTKEPFLGRAAWGAVTGQDRTSTQADLRVRIREDGTRVTVEADGLPAGTAAGPAPLRAGRWEWAPAP